MAKLRLGLVTYLGFLPLNHAFKEKLVGHKVILEYGKPEKLHRMFLDGELDICPISPIKYARHAGKCLLLPYLSLCSSGTVASVYLFSKKPVTELEGKTICLTTTSETSVILLKILLEHYYHVHANFRSCDLQITDMLKEGDAGLFMGDEAIKTHQIVTRHNMDINITDLGEAWKHFATEKMIYSLWAVRREYASKNIELASRVSSLLIESKRELPAEKLDEKLLKRARDMSGLTVEEIKDYFNNISYDFGEDCRGALSTFYDYAYKSGLIEERVKLDIWDKIL